MCNRVCRLWGERAPSRSATLVRHEYDERALLVTESEDQGCLVPLLAGDLEVVCELHDLHVAHRASAARNIRDTQRRLVRREVNPRRVCPDANLRNDTARSVQRDAVRSIAPRRNIHPGLRGRRQNDLRRRRRVGLRLRRERIVVRGLRASRGRHACGNKCNRQEPFHFHFSE